MEPCKQAGFLHQCKIMQASHHQWRPAFSMALQGKCRWRDSDQQSWLQART